MNMAIDELLWIEASRGKPFLRFYTWADRPVLSLGYFQSAPAVRSNPRLSRLPYVRRITGGGAIVHDNELTYALALPAALAPRTNDLYLLVHRAFAAALEDFGVGATVGPGMANGDRTTDQCFQRSDRHAIRVRGEKVLGSAQRRRPESVLMHGSLLLGTSRFTPDIPGLAELHETELSIEQLCLGFYRSVQTAFSLELAAGELPPRLVEQAEQLANSKYRTRAWNDGAGSTLTTCRQP